VNSSIRRESASLCLVVAKVDGKTDVAKLDATNEKGRYGDIPAYQRASRLTPHASPLTRASSSSHTHAR